MSYLDLTVTTAPSTPATNHIELYASSTDNHLRTIDYNGNILDFGGGTVNSGTANQIAYYATSAAAISGDSNITTDSSNNLNLLGSTAALQLTGGATGNYFGGAGATMYLGNNRTASGTIPNSSNSASTILLNSTTGASSIVLSVSAAINTSPTISTTLSSTGITFPVSYAINNSALNAAGYIIGTVVQALQTVDTTATTSSGTAYTSTATAQAITPKATTHKIRISVTGTIQNIASASSVAYVSIFRGSTDLSNGNGFITNTSATAIASDVLPAAIVYLDSPATTSATTYTVKIKSSASADSVWNLLTGSAVILVEEIAF